MFTRASEAEDEGLVSSHFGRRDFKNFVYATLQNAGLRTPDADHTACPYQNLVQHFLMDGPNSFDASTLRALCLREGLLDEGKLNARPLSIGVRSYVHFAERLESEVDELICVSSKFDGRHLAIGCSWETTIAEVCSFLGDEERRARLRATESLISLECHGSLAVLAGWELSRNSGVKIAPVQKPNLEVWRPSGSSGTSAVWNVQIVELNPDSEDVAICLSVTHDLRSDVEAYLGSKDAPLVRQLVVLTPEGGPSPLCIKGADHAYQLACNLPAVLTSARPNRRATSHLFFACPNALMFFIGQQREALGRLALYEFDFGCDRDGSYQFSFSLPPNVKPAANP